MERPLTKARADSKLVLVSTLAIALALTLLVGCARPHMTRTVCIDHCQSDNDRCLYWASTNDEIGRCDRNTRRCLDGCPLEP